MKRIVIIGGGAGGTVAAFELRKLDKDAAITIIEKTKNTEYSHCALPYVISGEIKNFESVFMFDEEDYEDNDINLLLKEEVKAIDTKKQHVVLKNSKVKYDKLIIATGSKTFVPDIDGLKEFYALKTIEDAKNIAKAAKKGSTAAIIGCGYIGIELAAALNEVGMNVKMIEACEHILPAQFDKNMADEIKEYLSKKNITFFEDTKVKEIKDNKVITDKKKIEYDMLILSCGIRPNIELAKGLKKDKGLIVNKYMMTSDNNIYACGDIVESTEKNTGKKIMSQLGSTAYRQAKVIADHISGNKQAFSEVVNASVSKVDEKYIGCVGITQERAQKLGIKTVNAVYKGMLKSKCYGSKDKLSLKLVCDSKGKLLGGQVIGTKDVSGKIEALSLALQKEMNVKELAKAEMPYNPAAASLYNHMVIAAEICMKKLG